jgi:hypothetical protein
MYKLIIQFSDNKGTGPFPRSNIKQMTCHWLRGCIMGQNNQGRMLVFKKRTENLKLWRETTAYLSVTAKSLWMAESI